MAKKTSGDIAYWINWIRDLHWRVLRLSKKYRNDYAALHIWLMKEAYKSAEDKSSSDEWVRSQDAKKTLICLELFELLFASRVPAFKKQVTKAAKPARRPHRSAGNRAVQQTARLYLPAGPIRGIPDDDYLSDYYAGELLAHLPKGSQDEILNRKAVFLWLFESTCRAFYPSLELIHRFCRKWELRCPLPPQVELPWDVDVFTGPYAQPIRSYRIDEKKKRLELTLFLGLGTEITNAFVGGLLHHVLPKSKHWTDVFTVPGCARIGIDFGSDRGLEQLLQEQGLFGRTISKKRSRSSRIFVRSLSKDQVKVVVELPVDKETVVKELRSNLPKSPLKLRQHSQREWDLMFAAQRLRLEKRKWKDIGLKLYPEEDASDPSRLGIKYRTLLRRFFPNCGQKFV